jgi:hypothetical protein
MRLVSGPTLDSMWWSFIVVPVKYSQTGSVESSHSQKHLGSMLVSGKKELSRIAHIRRFATITHQPIQHKAEP